MSLQWTAVATFLYAEVFAVLLLCVPFISPQRWHKIFKSRLVKAITTYGNTYFMVAIGILVFLLIDAFREVRKYSVTEKVDLSNNPVAVEHIHMKLFRAQRNEYIAGFALLLCLLLGYVIVTYSGISQPGPQGPPDGSHFCFLPAPVAIPPAELFSSTQILPSGILLISVGFAVFLERTFWWVMGHFPFTSFAGSVKAMLRDWLLRRLVTLLSQQATMMASNEAFKKQAEGASDAARKYMEENDKLQEKLREAGIPVPELGKKAGGGVEEQNKVLKEDVKKLKEELDTTKKALQKSESDVRAMKKQAENLTVEYDRLLEEHAKLQATCDGPREKKSD